MISKFSYMESPTWLKVGNSGNCKGIGVRSGSSAGASIPTHIYTNGKLFRKNSFSEACRVVDKNITGKTFDTFRDRGWHKFKDIDCFVYTDFEKLPEDLKQIIQNLEGNDDLLVR